MADGKHTTQQAACKVPTAFAYTTEVETPHVAYSYVRTSNGDSKEFSHENQYERIKAYWEYRLKPEGFIITEPYIDNGVSGAIPFMNRPAAKFIAQRLRPGDAVVCRSHNRCFRNVLDCLHCFEVWKKMGVSLHLLDLQCDTSTATGKMMMTMAAAVSEWERNQASERKIEVNAIRKAHNMPVQGNPPVGWLIVGQPGRKRFVRDHEVRAQLYQFLDLNRRGMNPREIWAYALRTKILRPHRSHKVGTRCGPMLIGPYWSLTALISGMKRARQWELDGERKDTERWVRERKQAAEARESA